MRLSRALRCVAVLGLALLASAGSASALGIYADSISTDPPAPDQVDATGWWDGGEPGGTYQPTTLSWEIADLGTHVHYRYSFTHPEHAASHLVLEVSDNFLLSDILEVYGDLTLADVEVGTYSDDGSSYQGMPGAAYALKFDAFSSFAENADGSVTQTIEFDSTKLPTWGDFYARGGRHSDELGGQGEWDAAWNVGFLSGEAPHDDDSNDGFHVAVPNSAVHQNIVPEPSTALLLGTGLAVLGRRRSRARPLWAAFPATHTRRDRRGDGNAPETVGSEGPLER